MPSELCKSGRDGHLTGVGRWIEAKGFSPTPPGSRATSNRRLGRPNLLGLERHRDGVNDGGDPQRLVDLFLAHIEFPKFALMGSEAAAATVHRAHGQTPELEVLGPQSAPGGYHLHPEPSRYVLIVLGTLVGEQVLAAVVDVSRQHRSGGLTRAKALVADGRGRGREPRCRRVDVS